MIEPAQSLIDEIDAIGEEIDATARHGADAYLAFYESRHGYVEPSDLTFAQIVARTDREMASESEYTRLSIWKRLQFIDLACRVRSAREDLHKSGGELRFGPLGEVVDVVNVTAGETSETQEDS